MDSQSSQGIEKDQVSVSGEGGGSGQMPHSSPRPYDGPHRVNEKHECRIEGIHFHISDSEHFSRPTPNSHWKVDNQCRIICSSDGESVACHEHVGEDHPYLRSVDRIIREPIGIAGENIVAGQYVTIGDDGKIMVAKVEENNKDKCSQCGRKHPYAGEDCPTCAFSLNEGTVFWQHGVGDDHYECDSDSHVFDEESLKILMEFVSGRAAEKTRSEPISRNRDESPQDEENGGEENSSARTSRHNHAFDEPCTDGCQFYFHVQVSKLISLMDTSSRTARGTLDLRKQKDKVQSLLYASPYEPENENSGSTSSVLIMARTLNLLDVLDETIQDEDVRHAANRLKSALRDTGVHFEKSGEQDLPSRHEDTETESTEEETEKYRTNPRRGITYEVHVHTPTGQVGRQIVAAIEDYERRGGRRRGQ